MINKKDDEMSTWKHVEKRQNLSFLLLFWSKSDGVLDCKKLAEKPIYAY